MTQADRIPAQEKEARLLNLFKTYGEVLIAYSGGVDSAYLADVAHEALGDKAQLIIADSPSIPREELQDALELAEKRNWPLTIISTDEFENTDFLNNDKMRCYYCKSTLFSAMREYANKNNISVIIYGETAEDSFDATRVGVQAAHKAHARAPLAEVGFTKDEIRACSHIRNLPTWNKPSFACLASRIPTNQPISIEVLSRIESAEALLKQAGCRQYRARHHDTLCRIEVETEDFERLIQPEVRKQLVEKIQALGYRYVTLDLAGYKTGSTAG